MIEEKSSNSSSRYTVLLDALAVALVQLDSIRADVDSPDLNSVYKCLRSDYFALVNTIVEALDNGS